MRLHRALGIFVAMLALIAAANPAAADTRDIDQGIGLPFFPCLAIAPVASFPAAPGTSDNEGAFGRICFVNIRGQWQAQTGEWILFRAAWVAQTEAQCDQFVANATVTEQFQGSPVAFSSLPCQARPAGDWAALFTFLTPPLPPGTYSDTFTFAFNADVFDGFFTYPAGTSLSFTSNLAVVSRG